MPVAYFPNVTCALFSNLPQREGMQGCTLSVPASWRPSGLTFTYHVSFISHQFSICVCACIWVCRCRCPCAHMRRPEEDIGRKDLTVQEVSPFWPGRLVKLLGSGYLTVLKLQAHEVVASFFFFLIVFIDSSILKNFFPFIESISFSHTICPDIVFSPSSSFPSLPSESTPFFFFFLSLIRKEQVTSRHDKIRYKEIKEKNHHIRIGQGNPTDGKET